MRELTGKRVLVTGGAMGIGFAIAQAFAREGAELVLTDMNEAALAKAAETLKGSGAKVSTYVLDVTDLAGIARTREAVNQAQGPIDVLVNNAGIVFGGPFLDVPLAKHLKTYEINVDGLVAMTHTFLPDLLARPEAHIVNIASASGFIGLPYGTTYASSKWAVIGFTESLKLELDMLGKGHVGVTAACPSYVSTGLFDGAKPPLFTRLLTADRLAAKVVGAVRSGKVLIRTPWLVKVTPALKGLLPFGMFYVVAGILGANTSMTQWKGRN